MSAEEMTRNGETKSQVPEELSILPLHGTVVFPGIITPLVVGQERSIRLVDEAVVKDRVIGVVAIRDDREKELEEGRDATPEDLYTIGTAVNIFKMLKMPDGTLRILVQGISRIRIGEYIATEPYFRARVSPVIEGYERDNELEALVLNLRDAFGEIAKLINVPEEFQALFLNIDDPGRMADLIASNMNLSTADRQKALETIDVKKRLDLVIRYMNKELQILKLRNEIQSQVSDEMSKTQREYLLREQLKAIQRELGEKDETTLQIEELRKKIEEAGLPELARKEAERELDRLAKMPPQAAEYTVSRTYLEWLTEMPWNISTEDNLDIRRAQQILDEDHYGLEKVKKRIIEYLAVRKLKADMKGPILCFAGPPGVGKTSMGRSIARALGRKFIRISLGGVRDEAEIRGHRRTYIGALPGRIIQGIRRAGSNNPVFMLDEIDKVGTDFRGDPSSALLEVLDPEQNNSFSDHYLDVPFDLSKVMFITTANILDTIPPALRDRMEVLDFPGYIEEEKLMIAKKFLVPKQLEEHGLKEEQLQFDDEAIKAIIRNYTREAGVRNLEREIATICRGVARKVAEGMEGKTIIKEESLHEYLGAVKFFSEVAERTGEPGVAVGMAWTPAGGDILFIESTMMRGGKGGLILTGQLGDVMRESAQAALSYIRSRADKLGIDASTFEKNDIHVHVPAGAIPKDGPSAGVTIATSLASLLTGRPARSDVSITGEVTLRGKVLPVGGIKEKVLAAKRAGIKTVILPKLNEKDLEEIPDNVKSGLTFKFVERIDEVLEIALNGSRKKEKKE
ncbi:MAG: endopeptidase La [bacterium]